MVHSVLHCGCAGRGLTLVARESNEDFRQEIEVSILVDMIWFVELAL